MERKYDKEDDCAWITCDVLLTGDYVGAGSPHPTNQRALKEELPEDEWYTEHGGYYSKQLWLLDNEANREIIKALEDNYPVVDEEMLSKVEDEWERKAWDDYGWPDIKREVRDDVLDSDDYATWEQEVEDKVDALNAIEEGKGNQWLLECYYGAKELANTYPTFEYDGACLHLDDMAEEFYDVTQAKLHPRIVHHPDQKLLPGTYP